MAAKKRKVDTTCEEDDLSDKPVAASSSSSSTIPVSFADFQKLVEAGSSKSWSDLWLQSDKLAALDKAGDEGALRSALENIAKYMLSGTFLMLNKKPHTFEEIEIYVTSKTHPDPFTHCDERQQLNGHWYFHRQNTSYKGGTFKGMDMAFGFANAHAGMLIRSIKPVGGELIEGPCCVVNHILEQTKSPSIANFVENHFSVEVPSCFDESSVLHIVPRFLSKEGKGNVHDVVQSGRVGLTLKTATSSSLHPHYILRPYRFLNKSSKLKKGRTYIVLQLLLNGLSAEEIKEATNTSVANVQKYKVKMEAGKKKDWKTYMKSALETDDLCELCGALSQLV